MLIVVSIILLFLAVLLYFHRLRVEGNAGLLTLRLLVIGLVIWIAFGYRFTFTWTRHPRRVVFLVDRSRSMKAIGADTAVERTASFLNSKLKGSKTEVWFFGERVLRSGAVTGNLMRTTDAGGERTRLGAALEAVARTRPGAVILLSDGQDNGERDVFEVLKNFPVPVWTVGFGKTKGRNLTVEDIDAPAGVFAGDTFEVRVRVASEGFNGNERVKLRLNDQVKEFVAGQEWGEQEVVFRMVFTESGEKRVVIQVDSFPGEITYFDNQRRIYLDVKPARTGVLYVTNRPGPQSRFIQQALSRNPRFNLNSLVVVTGRFPSKLPSTYPDVFVIDGAEEKVEDRDFWKAVASQIEKGSGAFIIAGENFKPGEILGSLLPVKDLRFENTAYISPIFTEEGKFLMGDENGLFSLNDLPPFDKIYTGIVKESTGTKAYRVWMRVMGTNEPLLVEGRIGRGKVAYLGGIPLWHWGFSPEFLPDRPTPLDGLLNAIVSCLSLKTPGQFLLETDSPEYLSGERVRIILRAFTPDGRPWEGLEVRLNLNDSAGRGYVLPLQEIGRGRYQLEIPGLEHGKYSAVAEIRAEGRLCGKVGVNFSVAEQSVELTRLGLDRRLLLRLAEITGGRFMSAESLEQFDPGDFTTGGYCRQVFFDPRRVPIFYGLLVLFYGLELIFRRKKGLL